MIRFETDNMALKRKFDSAISGLRANVRRVYGWDEPVLVEGGVYDGIWLECGPLEGLVYSAVDNNVAVNNHRLFFNRQRADGYLPCYVLSDLVGSGQIQMVVPIAATAYQLAVNTDDQNLMESAYSACSAWDDWLVKYRNTRGTGLCEAFCEFDTGHDNSPRWSGLPKMCLNGNPSLCPPDAVLPYLAPDLSATVYGGRLALSKMAFYMGFDQEGLRWHQKAEDIRGAIMRYCFDEKDLCFYDVDANGDFVRIKGDVLTRVLCEHVVDQKLFDQIYERHIYNPKSFWTPFPLPSIAVDDPAFVSSIPNNSWGGASQALTALRAPRWFDHYGKHSDLVDLMQRWINALVASPGFMQQMNPWSGEFSTSEGYSPAMCVTIDYISRLHGIRSDAGKIEWGCVKPSDSTSSSFTYQSQGIDAKLEITHLQSIAYINGVEVFRVDGQCRVVTDESGRVLQVIGITSRACDVELRECNAPSVRMSIRPDHVIDVAESPVPETGMIRAI